LILACSGNINPSGEGFCSGLGGGIIG